MSTPQAKSSPGYSISVDIPPGYHELPLSNIDEILSRAQPVVASVLSDDLRPEVPKVVGTLQFMLSKLASKNALYCGIGRHASTDGHPVSSWLTISSLDYGQAENPRLVLHGLATAKLADSSWQVEFVEIGGRQVLVSESVQTYPAPDVADLAEAGDAVPAYQLEALVPSGDGSAVAAIEFATSNVDQGPEYLAMIFAMVASLEFEKVLPMTSSLDL
ncbi:hypothetical protein [Nocardia sp. XZ_19_385]|uniref:hypothetical protein n=1 Tax=Nocardia sp. XZ_19_385 TaxID=2769488 RepID=UPI00188F5CAB|nr:hypothetical protein [Nocardia sp. XZ_19_385]